MAQSDLMSLVQVPTLTVRSEGEDGMSQSMTMPLRYSENSGDGDPTQPWRPKVSIGSRVLVGKLRPNDDPMCCSFYVGSGGGIGAAAGVDSTQVSIVQHAVVCEVVRSNAKWALVRAVYPLPPTTTQTHAMHCSFTPTTTNASTPQSQDGAGVTSPTLSPLSSPRTPVPPHRAGGGGGGGRLVAEGTADVMTVQLTVPAHALVSMLEGLLDTCGVLKKVQSMMDGRDFMSVLCVVDALIATHFSKGAGMDAQASGDERRYCSLLLLCGEMYLGHINQTVSASRVRPLLAILHAFRGYLLCSMGRHGDGLAAASDAFVCDATCQESYTVAASALYALNRLDEALVVVNACCNTRPRISLEFRFLATAIRTAHYFGSLLHPFGLDVVPVGLTDVVRTARIVSPLANRACTHVLQNTVLTPCAVDDCLGAQHGVQWFPHTLFRCVALRDFQKRCGSSDDPRRGSRASCGRANSSTVFTERVGILVPLAGVAHASGVRKDAVCGYCGWLLAPKTDILALGAAVHPQLGDRLRQQYPSCIPVSCEGRGCSERYCSDVCRVRAFVSYHELECEFRDAWKPLGGSRNESVASPDAIGFRFAGGAAQANKGGRQNGGTAVAAPESPSRQTDQSPLLNVESPRRRASDVLFAGLEQKPSESNSPQTSSGFQEELWPRRWSLAYGPQGQRGSLASELSGSINAGSTPSPRKSKVQTMFESRMQAARRSSTTLRGSSDVVATIRAAVKSALADFSEGLLKSAPLHVRTAGLVFIRCISTMLSLFFPATVVWDGPQRVQRQRAAAAGKQHYHKKVALIRMVIEACEERGLSSTGDKTLADKRDPHGLIMAEELMRRLGVPLTITERGASGTLTDVPARLPSRPTSPTHAKRSSLTIASSPPAGSRQRASVPSVPVSTATDALERLWVMVHAASEIVQQRCCDAAIAISAVCVASSSVSSAVGGGGLPMGELSQRLSPMSPFQMLRRFSAVWTVDEDDGSGGAATPGLQLSDKDEPNVWTIGRLLGFLQQPLFTEMLWELCLSSHTVVPLCAPAAAVGQHLPQHLMGPWTEACLKYRTTVAVLSRTLSLVTDWQSSPTGAHQAHSRFGMAPLSGTLGGPQASSGDLRGSRGLLSLSSQPSQSDAEGDDGLFDASGFSDGGTTSAGCSRVPSFSTSFICQTLQLCDARSQLDNGGNVVIDPCDASLCVPGERRVVVRALADLPPRAVLRLVNRDDFYTTEDVGLRTVPSMPFA